MSCDVPDVNAIFLLKSLKARDSTGEQVLDDGAEVAVAVPNRSDASLAQRFYGTTHVGKVALAQNLWGYKRTMAATDVRANQT